MPSSLAQRGRGELPGTIDQWLLLLGGATLVGVGLTRRSRAGLALAAGGAGLLWLGNRTGGRRHPHPATARAGEFVYTCACTVTGAPADVFAAWRDFETWPRFMRHLDRITPLGGNRYQWIARAPGGLRLTWDAEITAHRENEVLCWSSLPGSRVDAFCDARFRPVAQGAATEVDVRMGFRPPGGLLGQALLWLFAPLARKQMASDIQAFKRFFEQGQPVPPARRLSRHNGV